MKQSTYLPKTGSQVDQITSLFSVALGYNPIQSNVNKRAQVFLFARIFTTHIHIQIEAPPVPVNSE